MTKKSNFANRKMYRVQIFSKLRRTKDIKINCSKFINIKGQLLHNNMIRVLYMMIKYEQKKLKEKVNFF